MVTVTGVKAMWVSSVLRMAPICIDTGQNTPPHGKSQTSDHVIRDAPPLLLQSLFQLWNGDWLLRTTSQLSSKVVPQVFYGRQVWGTWRPRQQLNVMAVRKSMVSLAVWGLALSCWRITPRCCLCMKGITTGCRTWSLYLWAVRVWRTTTKSVLWSPQMPPQTITLPPP